MLWVMLKGDPMFVSGVVGTGGFVSGQVFELCVEGFEESIGPSRESNAILVWLEGGCDLCLEVVGVSG